MSRVSLHGLCTDQACTAVDYTSARSPHLASEPCRLAASGVLANQPHAPADEQIQALCRVVLPAAIDRATFTRT